METRVKRKIYLDFPLSLSSPFSPPPPHSPRVDIFRYSSRDRELSLRVFTCINAGNN